MEAGCATPCLHLMSDISKQITEKVYTNRALSVATAKMPKALNGWLTVIFLSKTVALL